MPRFARVERWVAFSAEICVESIDERFVVDSAPSWVADIESSWVVVSLAKSAPERPLIWLAVRPPIWVVESEPSWVACGAGKHPVFAPALASSYGMRAGDACGGPIRLRLHPDTRSDVVREVAGDALIVVDSIASGGGAWSARCGDRKHDACAGAFARCAVEDDAAARVHGRAIALVQAILDHFISAERELIRVFSPGQIQGDTFLSR